jgi:hypothetical protein
MIDDLTMLANLPVNENDVEQIKHEEDKAAAGETMPAPKHKDETPDDNPHESTPERVARRGQDPPEQEPAAEEDR